MSTLYARRLFTIPSLIALGMLFFVLVAYAVPYGAKASTTFRAIVVEVISESRVFVPGINAETTTQTLRAQIDGGVFITLQNDRMPLAVGDAFFVGVLEHDGETLYTVLEPDRRDALVAVVALFVVATILIGGLTGTRALFALAISIGMIVFVLVPAIAAGYSPILVSIALSAVILALAMGVTHGINWTTAAALSGSVVTIGVAIILAEFFVSFAHLSGFADDTTTILNLTTGGALNMQGVLLGAMIIGILGIIDDISVTQVATVRALAEANATFSFRELYARGMKVGREHFGAVINTLFFAYSGAALPLLMLFTLSPSSPWILINSEIMAIEIVRAAIGGVALALALPITTALGVWVARHVPNMNAPSHHHHHH